MSTKAISKMLRLALPTFLLAGCASTFPSSMSAPADGDCPILTGVYRNEGKYIDSGSKHELSYLVSLRDGWLPSPRMPEGQYFDRRIYAARMSHPTPNVLRIETLNKDDVPTGRTDLRPQDGWNCRAGAFFKMHKGDFQGEAVWGDAAHLDEIFLGSDRSLILREKFWSQHRSVFTLGAPIGRGSESELVARFERREPY